MEMFLGYFRSRRWCDAVALTLGPAFRNRWVAGFLPEVACTVCRVVAMTSGDGLFLLGDGGRL